MFLLRQAAVLLWQYFVPNSLISVALENLSPRIDQLQASGTKCLVFQPTVEQLSNRLVSTLIIFARTRVHMDMGHRFLSLLLVGTGLNRPEDWPPLFGSVWDAYTLRNFWG